MVFTAVAMVCMAGSTAPAHHGVSGRYDVSQPIVLSGTITQASFSPPHPVLSVRVDTAEMPELETDRPPQLKARPIARQEDVGMVRRIELSPVRMFFELGPRVRNGDRVTILALRNCLPPHQLRSFWIRLADGQIISHEGDWARGVEGCG